jgi:hypothetical protein
MKSRSKVRIIIAGNLTLALIIAAPFVLWRGPRPICGRLIDGAFQEWWLENVATNCDRDCPYPNVDGSESRSLAAIEPFIGPEIHQYGYVPGLHEDDSGLVLMYMKVRTAYTWHGDSTHTILSPRHWMVLSPGSGANGMGGYLPEGGELLDTAEFKRRLEATLAYLKEQQRPYWPVVVEEQSKFLKSLEH